MTSRRKAREAALQILYALDTSPEPDPAVALATHFERFAATEREEDQRAETLDRPFAEALVRGVVERRPEIDEILAQVSRNWRIERMAQVDRNILRIAIYELAHRDDIPARVTLNEAIELAKRFGAAEAPAFVNGLLDTALRVLEVKK